MDPNRFIPRAIMENGRAMSILPSRILKLGNNGHFLPHATAFYVAREVSLGSEEIQLTVLSALTHDGLAVVD
jgi:hypothetical protein